MTSAGDEELRERILTEFKQVYRLASQGDYTENCTNVVMRLITASNQQLLRELEEKRRSVTINHPDPDGEPLVISAVPISIIQDKLKGYGEEV